MHFDYIPAPPITACLPPCLQSSGLRVTHILFMSPAPDLPTFLCPTCDKSQRWGLQNKERPGRRATYGCGISAGITHGWLWWHVWTRPRWQGWGGNGGDPWAALQVHNKPCPVPEHWEIASFFIFSLWTGSYFSPTAVHFCLTVGFTSPGCGQTSRLGDSG